jgi:hypothetical protein
MIGFISLKMVFSGAVLRPSCSQDCSKESADGAALTFLTTLLQDLRTSSKFLNLAGITTLTRIQSLPMTIQTSKQLKRDVQWNRSKTEENKGSRKVQLQACFFCPTEDNLSSQFSLCIGFFLLKCGL